MKFIKQKATTNNNKEITKLVVGQWQIIFLLVITGSSHFVVESKVFERCELAKILRDRHGLDLAEVAQWVCIAQHSSGLNAATHITSTAGGSHGLFQISDVYWCSTVGQGGGCNIPCKDLKNDDLSDDVLCIRHIYTEHQRISGDGYTAWNAYQQYCKHDAESYIQDCFQPQKKGAVYFQRKFSDNALQYYTPKATGKVYERCELARELFNKHEMPMKQIPTWVCIAEYESRFNTAALGRRNTDGSADHGIFQISDLYWCSHDRYSGSGKACGLPCSKLLDNDITDDVRCIKKIFSEHTALTGNGFSAWTVYNSHCRYQDYAQIAKCFANIPTTQYKNEIYGVGLSSNNIQTTFTNFIPNKNNPFFKQTPRTYDFSRSNKVYYNGKVYTRCSLAQELYFKHNFPLQDISIWVCIAEHESQFNTSAIGQLNIDGSVDHGLFQINDRYWCDNSAYGGKACALSCNKLLDDDLKDDVACIKIIHEEHTRLSGDGFNAWPVYKSHCQNQNIEQLKVCFDEKLFKSYNSISPSSSFNTNVIQGKGKIYTKCSLAQELYQKHEMPMEQIPTWVCIAQYESSYNTAAVGRLNTDGSADHGLFQISDLYWCTHDQYGGKACNIPCDKLLDSDITDDVRCIRAIHEEHTRISGDGFNAWTVYQPHCRNKAMDHIKDCFTERQLRDVQANLPHNSLIPASTSKSKSTQKGKIYKKCELAQELFHKHHMPMEQIATWVCIAQYESSYNTAAVGRLNTDGSADHGLFQISDLYWCTHDQYGGKACNIPCDKLLDGDLTDDVRCVKIIYEEHTRISGDGFSAWTVYKPHCLNQEFKHVENCFTPNQIEQFEKKTRFQDKGKNVGIQKVTQKVSFNQNPFSHRGESEASDHKQNQFTSLSTVVDAPSNINNKKHKQHFLNASLKATTSVQIYHDNKIQQKTTELKGQVNSQLSSQNKLHTNENHKNYINSNHFRTTAVTAPKHKTTHRRPTTATPPIKQQPTSTKKSTSRTTEKSTTKKRLATESVTVPKSYSPVTTKRPTTTTTKNSAVKSLTTKSAKTTTSWSWPNTTSTTTKRPKLTTTWNHNYKLLSTLPPQITTTWSWQHQKYNHFMSKTSQAPAAEKKLLEHQNSTTSKPTIFPRTPSTKPTKRAASMSSTTENWRKWDQTTTRYKQELKIPNHMAVTTTANPKKTTIKATTAPENWRKTDKKTTKKFSTTTTSTLKPNTTWKYGQKSTTTKPKASTENWRKWDKPATLKSNTTTTNTIWKNRQTSGTKSPITTTENWRKLSKATTSTANNTTPKPNVTTWNWRKKTSLTTTKPLTSTETWRKWIKAGRTAILET